MVVGLGLSCKPITLALYSNFQIFVTVVTGVGLANYIAQLHSLTPEQPNLFGHESRTHMLYTPCSKKNQAPKLLAVPLSNLNRFVKFFH